MTRCIICIKNRPEAKQDIFFKHRNVLEPPSLSKNGELYQGTKSRLIDCLLCISTPAMNPKSNMVMLAVFDIASVIQLVKPGIKSQSFKD